MWEGIFNLKDSGDQIYYGIETSEEGYKRGVNGERDSRKDRREWILGHTMGTCVIWCGKFHSGTWSLDMLA